MGYELATLITSASKPNRLTDNKNEEYHALYGRWAVFHANTNKHAEHMSNIATNYNFYAPNKQWNYEEDVVGFLQDTSGRETNRIRVEMNYIQILVNQYVGNSYSMAITSRCSSFSPLVKTRKEEKLNELLLQFDIASVSNDPNVKGYVASNFPIGNSEQETVESFDNYYVDKYVKAINGLLKYSETINKFQNLKVEIAEDLALTGISVVKPEIYANEYRFRIVKPNRFFFDRSAVKIDLSDAAYMGEWDDMLPSELYEQYPNISSKDRYNIENHVSNYGFWGNNNVDRIRVFKVYWRDVTEDKWGYIKDEFDDIVFRRIDYISETDDEPTYKEKDVVSVSKLNRYQRSIVRKKKGSTDKAMVKTYTDLWRFCEFVPSEYLSSIYDNNSNNGYGDLVLNYGIVPFQEPNIYSPYNMELPYKIATYIYNDGYVYSPVDIAINPQRLANRIMSVVENMMNNSRGSGTVFAQESLDRSSMSIEDIQYKMKMGDPVSLPAQSFGGVNNAVGRYDATLGEGAFNFLNMANVFLQSIEKITGVNDAMKGQQTHPDQLVGTMQMMIQRGSVIQARFYGAIRELFRQCYQAVATSGKRLYIQEKPKLVAMIGDDAADVIELTQDMALEDFRVTVKVSNDEQTERQSVDTMLMQFLQAKLIDRKRFANIIGRGDTDDMWDAIRQYSYESDEMEKQMAQVQQQEMQKQQEMQQQNLDRSFNSQDEKNKTDLAREVIKSESKKQNI